MAGDAVFPATAFGVPTAILDIAKFLLLSSSVRGALLCCVPELDPFVEGWTFLPSKSARSPSNRAISAAFPERMAISRSLRNVCLSWIFPFAYSFFFARMRLISCWRKEGRHHFSQLGVKETREQYKSTIPLWALHPYIYASFLIWLRYRSSSGCPDFYAVR